MPTKAPPKKTKATRASTRARPAKKTTRRASAAESPAKPSPHARTAGMSDTAVKAKTGKDWAGWIAALDRAGASKLDHPSIASLLSEKFGIGDWWCQMVAVGYERARGLRQKHERPDGYSVSASRTIGVPIGAAYKAWSDKSARSRWLGGSAITIRKATANKSMRITWGEGSGRTNVEAMFYARGDSKCQVTVQHSKIDGPDEAAALKAFWGQRLDALKAMFGP